MCQQNEVQPVGRAAAEPRLAWVLLLFAGSGCAALIYELVWLQMLQLVVGSSAVSLGILLATFMGGMCVGSLALARLILPRPHPLRVYGLIELGLGLCGTLVWLVMPQVSRFYVAAIGYGLPGMLLRASIGAACLLPPTLLMGATLPAISRWVSATPGGVCWLGFFYAGNLAGAVFGCLLAEFYLLRVHDMATATWFAVSLNALVGVSSLWLARGAAHYPAIDRALTPICSRGPLSQLVYATIALSGFCALSAEVVWTRLLSLVLGPTVYTFSIILAVFLVGLGLGSSLGSLWARDTTRPSSALAWCQLSQMATIAWASYIIARSLPFWPINPFLSRNVWADFQLDLVRCAWAILPATCLWGASFPLALAAAADRQDPGHIVGRVYAANTAGAIVGALVSSLVLISWIGAQNTQRLLVGASALAGLLALVPVLNFTPTPSTEQVRTWPRRARPVLTVMALSALGLGLAMALPRLPWELIAYGRYLATKLDFGTVLYVGEGRTASVAVSEMSNGARNFHVSGKIEASTDAHDMRLQRLLGHLPALIHPAPRSVLVVGCGAGVTAGSFIPYPTIERIVICEIEPLIPQVVADYFANQNYNVVNDPRVQIIYDDARHYVLTTSNKFDIITSDPIHPWVRGAASLYTKEYFDLCKQHLNPGGFVSQWVPLYESTRQAVRSEFATFFQTFPQGTIWSNDQEGTGYDLILLGQREPSAIDVDAVQERLRREDYTDVAQSLREIGCQSVIGLLATYAGRGQDLDSWLQHAQINRDRNLRLQFLAGMGLNAFEEELIYSDLLRVRKFPDDLFIGSEQRKKALRMVLEKNRGK